MRLWDDKICISGAQGADLTSLGAQEFRCRGFALPKSVESGNLGPFQGCHPADGGEIMTRGDRRHSSVRGLELMGFASVTMTDNGGAPAVVNVVQETLMRHSITRSVQPNDDLLEAGLTSVAFAELVHSVEAEFDLTIPDTKMVLANFRSIFAITKLVSALLKDFADSCGIDEG